MGWGEGEGVMLDRSLCRNHVTHTYVYTSCQTYVYAEVILDISMQNSYVCAEIMLHICLCRTHSRLKYVELVFKNHARHKFLEKSCQTEAYMYVFCS